MPSILGALHSDAHDTYALPSPTFLTPLTHKPPPHCFNYIPPDHTNNMSSNPTSPNWYYCQYQEASSTRASLVCTRTATPPVSPTVGGSLAHTRAVTPTLLRGVESFTPTQPLAHRYARKTRTLTTDSNTTYYGGLTFPNCTPPRGWAPGPPC